MEAAAAVEQATAAVEHAPHSIARAAVERHLHAASAARVQASAPSRWAWIQAAASTWGAADVRLNYGVRACIGFTIKRRSPAVASIRAVAVPCAAIGHRRRREGSGSAHAGAMQV